MNVRDVAKAMKVNEKDLLEVKGKFLVYLDDKSKIDKISKILTGYDTQTWAIDDYSQLKKAEEKNEEILKNMGRITHGKIAYESGMFNSLYIKEF